MHDGAEFGLHNGDAVVISDKEILYYIELVCKKYYRDYPDDSDEIAEYIRRFNERCKQKPAITYNFER